MVLAEGRDEDYEDIRAAISALALSMWSDGEEGWFKLFDKALNTSQGSQLCPLAK